MSPEHQRRLEIAVTEYEHGETLEWADLMRIIDEIIAEAVAREHAEVLRLREVLRGIE